MLYLTLPVIQRNLRKVEINKCYYYYYYYLSYFFNDLFLVVILPSNYYDFLLVLLVLRTIQTRWSCLGESIGTDKIVNSCANYCKLITSVNFYTL